MSSQVMTMRTPSSRLSPRSGPLAQSIDVQYPFDACSGLRQLQTCKSSQVLYYLPSRRNRRCATAHSDQAYIQNILQWCIDAAKRLFVLVVIFLAMRAVIGLALYICRPHLIFASMATEHFPSPLPSMSTLCQTRSSSLKSTETAQKSAAVLQFVSDHIMHATSAATLTAGLTTRLRLLLNEDYADMKTLLLEAQSTEQRKEFDEAGLRRIWVNLSDPHTPLIDFTPGGLIGKTFTHALDELDYLSTSSLSDYSCPREDQETRALAVYHRTASNLLLEYSAAHQRIRRLLFELRMIRQRLTATEPPWKCSHRTNNIRRFLWRRSVPSLASKEETVGALVSKLESVIGYLLPVASYLDRMTDQLAQLNVPERPMSSRKSDLTTSWSALRDLFARSTMLPRNQRIFSGNMNNSYATLKRVKVILPRTSMVRMVW
ncbi:hypothetical protein V8B97DRAFT_1920099 [Scleroderma yunnanense]